MERPTAEKLSQWLVNKYFKLGTIYTPGIIPFTLKKICDCKESSQKFTCSFVEIYNDELFDLLATKSDEKVKLYYKTIKHKLHIKSSLYIN